MFLLEWLVYKLLEYYMGVVWFYWLSSLSWILVLNCRKMLLDLKIVLGLVIFYICVNMVWFKYYF